MAHTAAPQHLLIVVDERHGRGHQRPLLDVLTALSDCRQESVKKTPSAKWNFVLDFTSIEYIYYYAFNVLGQVNFNTGTCIVVCMCCSFLFFSCSLFFSFLSFNVSGIILACTCCACHIQYDGMALHCLLPLLILYCDVVSASYIVMWLQGFCKSIWSVIRIPRQTRIVLDVDASIRRNKTG